MRISTLFQLAQVSGYKFLCLNVLFIFHNKCVMNGIFLIKTEIVLLAFTQKNVKWP